MSLSLPPMFLRPEDAPGAEVFNVKQTLAQDPAPGRADDYQRGGNHYKGLAMQPWDVMQAWMTKEQFNGFLLCSALAYIARFNTAGVAGKGGRTDIEKAAHYLEKWLQENQHA